MSIRNAVRLGIALGVLLSAGALVAQEVTLTTPVVTTRTKWGVDQLVVNVSAGVVRVRFKADDGATALMECIVLPTTRCPMAATDIISAMNSGNYGAGWTLNRRLLDLAIKGGVIQTGTIE